MCECIKLSYMNVCSSHILEYLQVYIHIDNACIHTKLHVVLGAQNKQHNCLPVCLIVSSFVCVRMKSMVFSHMCMQNKRVYVYIFVEFVCRRVYVWFCMYACIICVNVCMRAMVCLSAWMCGITCMYVCIYVYLYMHMYVCHTGVYECMQAHEHLWHADYFWRYQPHIFGDDNMQTHLWHATIWLHAYTFTCDYRDKMLTQSSRDKMHIRWSRDKMLTPLLISHQVVWYMTALATTCADIILYQ
jgi:hypothetical protein